MDHLLAMPLTPFQIAMSKVWANGLVIALAVAFSLYVVVRMILAVPIAGSIPLFMVGVVIYLFFATAVGIFLGTVARSMPQFGLMFMLVFLPMNMLSGSNTPLESMPAWLSRSWRRCRRLTSCRLRSRSCIAAPALPSSGRISCRWPSSGDCSSRWRCGAFARLPRRRRDGYAVPRQPDRGKLDERESVTG